MPLYVNVTLKNVSDHAIEIVVDRRRGPEHDFVILVREGGGKRRGEEARATAHGRAVKGKRLPTDPMEDLNGSDFPLTKGPGETLTARLDVSRQYELGPGKYIVRAQRFNQESKSLVTSNAVTVTVTP